MVWGRRTPQKTDHTPHQAASYEGAKGLMTQGYKELGRGQTTVSTLTGVPSTCPPLSRQLSPG